MAVPKLAVGVGFRKACSGATLAALVREALARVEDQLGTDVANGDAVLATIAEKDRPTLREAAAELGLPVLILSKDAFPLADDRITMESVAAKACFGIASVAEAAALAAAGPRATLIVSRLTTAQATCAIAAAAASR